MHEYKNVIELMLQLKGTREEGRFHLREMHPFIEHGYFIEQKEKLPPEGRPCVSPGLTWV